MLKNEQLNDGVPDFKVTDQFINRKLQLNLQNIFGNKEGNWKYLKKVSVLWHIDSTFRLRGILPVKVQLRQHI